jgi:putative NADH-flavin reductase
MRLVVFGATGGTGRQLVTQALAQGHDVITVVRDPARLPLEHANLRAVQADVFDPESVKPAVDGADAVLFALGPRRGADDMTVCSRGVRSVLEAMQTTGMRRIVAVSASPVPKQDPGDGALQRASRPLLHLIFGRLYADLALMETQLRESSTDWTVFRPPLLTNGPLTGHYQTTLGRNATGLRVSRADLADAMLRCLENSATIRTAVGIAG